MDGDRAGWWLSALRLTRFTKVTVPSDQIQTVAVIDTDYMGPAFLSFLQLSYTGLSIHY